MALVSPSVADISRKVVRGRVSSGICQATAALLVAVVVELVHHHVVDARLAPPAARGSPGSPPCSRRSARRG